MLDFQAELRSAAQAKGEALRARVRVQRAGQEPPPSTGSTAEL
jgi:hypothetical protein